MIGKSVFPTVVERGYDVHDAMSHLLEALDEAEQKEFFGGDDLSAASQPVCDART